MSAVLALSLKSSAGAVTGSSTDTDYKGTIELDAFSFTGPPYSDQPRPSTTTSTSSDAFTFTIDKKFDYSSPQLLQICSQHQCGKAEPFKSATLSLRPVHGYVLLTMIFSELYIKSYEVEGKFEDKDIPKEKIIFSFRTFEIQYRPLLPTTGNPGTLMSAGWNLKTMQKLQTTS
jgi:type VI protein secretion system component Hcp